MDDGAIIAPVHIVSSDVKMTDDSRTYERSSFHNSFIMVAGSSLLILPHSPNRKQAVITVTGTGTDTAILAGSQGDADRAQGAAVQVGQVIHLNQTSEVWATAKTGTSVVLGVHAVYCR